MMAKKKINEEPTVIVGKHSVRTEYPDGRVEFESDYDKLRAEVIEALEEHALNQKKPAVKAKSTRKKKDVEA